ncbi:hypothetical protein [Paracidovorax citrulli]|uniref:hypothetical protein n=1 Tax=Paracidovorax citrulli TaxID=80869 RepID=UPI001E55E01A|nr:hypothetical protein [Paracidovorax citrulli]
MIRLVIHHANATAMATAAATKPASVHTARPYTCAHILLGKIRGLPVEIGERAQGAGHGIESLLRRPEEHPGRFGPRIGRQREQPGLRLRIGIACGAVLAEQALLLAGRDQGA